MVDLKSRGYDKAGLYDPAGVGGEPFVARAVFASPNYFEVLGTPPAAGRLTDGTRAALPIAAVSHAFAVKHFGGRDHALGHALSVNGQTLQIVGVTPAGFIGHRIAGVGDERAEKPQLWLPLAMHPAGAAGQRCRTRFRACSRRRPAGSGA